MRFAIRGVPRARRAISSAASSAISTPRMRALRRTIERELLVRVEVEPERQPEAVAERRRQQAGARGRADQRERRQVERQRARGRPLADDDVEPEVLERRVEDLLDRAVQAVDLVDEEHVARLERGEDRGDVALALERRAGDLADADAELLADDLRERGLAEAGRAREQDVVERLAARLRRVERDRELLLHALLADEVGERLRAQRAVELLLAARRERRREEPARSCRLPAARRAPAPRPAAPRRRPASARSASTQRPAELDERVAREQRAAASAAARRSRRRQLLLQLEHDALRGLAADAGDRLEARGVVAHDRAAQLLRRRPGDDRERDLRPDARDAEQQLEQLALVGRGEAVELERVLADVQVGLDGRLLADARVHPRRRGDEVADTADVDDDARARCAAATVPRRRAIMTLRSMRNRTAGGGCLLPALESRRDADEKPLLFLVMRVRGPDWDPTRERREQEGWDEHAAFMDSLAEAGRIVLGGPAGDGDGDEVLVVDAPDEDAVLRAPRRRSVDGNDPRRAARSIPWTIWLDGRGRVARPSA